MNKNRIYYLIMAVIVVFLIILLVNFYHRPKEKGTGSTSSQAAVKSFEECQSAGYPTTSTYPKVCNTPDGSIFVEDLSPASATSSSTASASSSSEMTYKDLIKVSNLRTNDSIKSPLHIEGEARGQWFFEATFPIKVTDQSGNILGMGNAKAEQDWMTTSYVPFTADISFTNLKGVTSGYVILEKDNPSGIPEKDDSFKIPVVYNI